jgi:hypothetical protein
MRVIGSSFESAGQNLIWRNAVNPKLLYAAVAGTLLLPSVSWADFKYVERTQFTGGAMAGLLKFAARAGGKGNGADSSTYYIKGNRMRVEDSDGEVQIIDLDGRQIISIDPKKKTYAILTFAEMRAQMEQLQQLRGQKSKVTLTPKVQVTQTQNTKAILGQNTREVQATVELKVADPTESGSGATTIVSDSWIAPSVRGYEEVRNFYQRMSRELNWTPGKGLSADPRLSEAMEEMRKNAPILAGFPLESSVKMSGSLSGTKRSTEEQGSSGPSSADIPTSVPTSKGDAVNEALGGLLSLRKKKQNSSEEKSANSKDGTLLTAKTEVTSFSSATLDASLFEIPAGYRQVQDK